MIHMCGSDFIRDYDSSISTSSSIMSSSNTTTSYTSIEKIACCTSMMHEKREHLCGSEGVAMIFNYCGHLLFG